MHVPGRWIRISRDESPSALELFPLESADFSGYQHSAPSNEKDPASFRKLDPSRIPRKQLKTELIFQIAYLLAQCGLRDVEPVSCPPQARFLLKRLLQLDRRLT
jgi:hypothetical protein